MFSLPPSAIFRGANFSRFRPLDVCPRTCRSRYNKTMALAPALLYFAQAAAHPACAPPEEQLRTALIPLSQRAEVSAQLPRRTFGVESLEQRFRRPPPRFRPRVAGEPSPPRFQTREIVSEYGFAALQETPGALRELRQVMVVDGRQVRP